MTSIFLFIYLLQSIVHTCTVEDFDNYLPAATFSTPVFEQLVIQSDFSDIQVPACGYTFEKTITVTFVDARCSNYITWDEVNEQLIVFPLGLPILSVDVDICYVDFSFDLTFDAGQGQPEDKLFHGDVGTRFPIYLTETCGDAIIQPLGALIPAVMTVTDGGDLVQTSFEDPGDDQSQGGAHLDYCGRRSFQIVDSSDTELWWVTIDFV